MSWDRCIFPLFVRIFSVSKPFFSILLFNLYRCAVADAQSNESNRVQMQCVNMSKKNVQKNGQRSKKLQVQFLASIDEPMSWFFFFLVFQTLSFIQIKSFMCTQANKKHNAPQNNLFVNTMEIFASVCTTHNHVLCLCLICFDHNQSIYGSHTAFTVYTYIRSIPLMVEWKWNVSSYI